MDCVAQKGCIEMHEPSKSSPPAIDQGGGDAHAAVAMRKTDRFPYVYALIEPFLHDS
jgi:hypothetical protein